jgi:23S rRNA (uridine2552-2'-O)-methyltransferase
MPKKSSRRWLDEHFSDPYVKQAQQAGYRSRAAFKLIEIQDRDRLFKPGMTVVDLGAAPGGWSQILVKLVKPKGHVIALDILPMDDIPGVDFILGDFTEDAVLEILQARVTTQIDWVVSDMAPNMSGNDSTDIPRAMYLVELALDFALKTLQSDGGFLAKVFQGPGSEEFIAAVKQNFKSVSIRKPNASRGRSREVYILAKGLKAK